MEQGVTESARSRDEQWLARAELAWRSGQYRRADEICSIVDARTSNQVCRVLARALRARSQLKLDAPNLALRYARMACEGMPAPDADLLLLLGDTCMATGNCESALKAYRRAESEGGSGVAVWSRIAAAAGQLGRAEEAAAAHRQCVTQGDESPSRRLALAEQLIHSGRAREAAHVAESVVATNRRDVSAWVVAGHAWRAAGQPRAAEYCYSQALILAPEHRGVLVARGMSRIAAGDLSQGFADYEARHCLPKLPFPSRLPEWFPDSARQTVLLWDEQGAGDAIQFVRYASWVKELGHTTLLYAEASRVRLLSSCGVFDQAIARGDRLPRANSQAALMSLPARLGPTALRRGRSPYLFAEPDRIEFWKQRFAWPDMPRIGLAWQGNPRYFDDRRRSPRLAPLLPLIRSLRGRARFYALQKGPGSEELATQRGSGIVDLGAELDTGLDAFVDSAAVMQCLDLVVTSDTAIAHLAGALGTPVWVLLCHNPDWRWGSEGTTTHWYPSARLFRQPEPGAWAAAVSQLRDALEREWLGIDPAVLAFERATRAARPAVHESEQSP